MVSRHRRVKSLRSNSIGTEASLLHLRSRGGAPQPQPYLPWQCLYFLPEPQGQSSLRPTLPQLAGFFGSRSILVCGTSDAEANAISSSPVFGSSLCTSIGGSTGCCSSG